MRRTTAIALAAIATALAIIPVVGAAPPGPDDDVNGPRCANILSGQASYDTDADTGKPTVTALLTLDAAACRNLSRYVLHVQNQAGTTELATTIAIPGGFANEVGFRYEFGAGAPAFVCVYATSHAPGGRQIDRAPNTGCVELELDAGAGGRTFQG